jgi:protoporphyrinogen IX oxidase
VPPSFWIALHVSANLVWIGSLLSAVVLATAPAAAERVPGSERASWARLLYRRLAVPAFVVSLVSGGIPLLLNTSHYFVVTRFMHAKLLLAFFAIVLHHLVGGTLKRLAAGTGSAGTDARSRTRRVAVYGWAFFACALGAAWLAVLKPF